MTKISDAQRKALDTINSGRVFMLNDGSTDTKGVTSATVKALRKTGLIVPNGASRTVVKGRAARRLVLTPAGIAA